MNLQIKLIVLGNQFVGKTTLIKKLTNENFIDYYMATIGVDYDRLVFKKDNNEHEIILWDTSGQDRFNFLLDAYFKTVNGALILYDVTDKQSFTQATKWVEELRIRKKNDNIPILLIGNKTDIKDPIITTKDLEKVSKQLNVKILEISLKNNINVDKILNDIVDDYIQKINSNLLNLKDNNINLLKRKKSGFVILEEKQPDPKCCSLM